MARMQMVLTPALTLTMTLVAPAAKADGGKQEWINLPGISPDIAPPLPVAFSRGTKALSGG